MYFCPNQFLDFLNTANFKVMEHKHKNEDIDLGIFLKKAKSFKRKSAMGFYRSSRFLFSNWIVLLVLLISGIVIGYVWEKLGKDTKEGTLLVQINFDASAYVYNSIEILNNKIKDNDSLFLKEIGLYENQESILKEIEIEPVVNLMDILNQMRNESADIEPFIEQAQYEDNLLKSEVFIPEYKIHKLKILTSETGGEETIEKILHYLNGDKLLQQTKEVIVENTKFKIKENLNSVASIDSITANYGKSTMGSASQIYFNSPQVVNIHMLYEEKEKIMENIQELQSELLKYENPVISLSKPKLTVRESFDDKKMFILPIVFLLVFLVGVFLIRSYHTGKKLVEDNRQA